MKILVTGGLGYIGSHTVVELLNKGHDVVVIDNLCNSKPKVKNIIEDITGKNFDFYKCDIRDIVSLDNLLYKHKIDCCIHFAGLKSVGESVQEPLRYYENNIVGTIALLESLSKHNCKNIIFSSSATVYGEPATIPITEECPKGKCTNPYGWSKCMLEQIFSDIEKADKEWNIVLFRYFNPLGSHLSCKLGEDPNGIPNNLMPYITQVAIGKQKYLGIFGADNETYDGTGIRDYIHVVDLAKGHIMALNAIKQNCGLEIYNLGTGKGYSVFEVVKNFEKVSGINIPFKILPRREGDVAICYSDPSKAERELNWKAEYGIYEMCRDSWNWQSKNPNGYE